MDSISGLFSSPRQLKIQLQTSQIGMTLFFTHLNIEVGKHFFNLSSLMQCNQIGRNGTIVAKKKLVAQRRFQ